EGGAVGHLLLRLYPARIGPPAQAGLEAAMEALPELCAGFAHSALRPVARCHGLFTLVGRNRALSRQLRLWSCRGGAIMSLEENLLAIETELWTGGPEAY